MHASEKVCPQCRCVYRWTASDCADCGVPLVHPEQVRDEELPRASNLVPIRIASVMWSRGFSEALSSAGIPHRIDAPPGSGELAERLRRSSHDQEVAVYVRAEDRERALAADTAYMRTQIPDLPDESERNEPQESGEDCCPACGEPTDAQQSDCSGCGLFLGEPA